MPQSVDNLLGTPSQVSVWFMQTANINKVVLLFFNFEILGMDWFDSQESLFL